jgi:DNA-directed RNA polymerase subunit RPC12/RpoP
MNIKKFKLTIYLITDKMIECPICSIEIEQKEFEDYTIYYCEQCQNYFHSNCVTSSEPFCPYCSPVLHAVLPEDYPEDE